MHVFIRYFFHSRRNHPPHMKCYRAKSLCALLSWSASITSRHTFNSATRHIHTATPNKSSNQAVDSAASSLTRLQIDSIRPPSGDALTVSSAVAYLDQLRKTHRCLGVAPAASDLRWRAREFLHSVGSAPQTARWPMTEEFAFAIINASVHFEVVLFECPYGQSAVEFLMMLWKHRIPSGERAIDSSVTSNNGTGLEVMPTNKEVHFSDVSALGRLVMAALSQLTNGTLTFGKADRLLLSQFLCDVLLPAAIQILNNDFFLSSNSAIPMPAAEAEAFSVLLSALTKAAVTKWARQEANCIVFGPPPGTNGSNDSPSLTSEVFDHNEHMTTKGNAEQGVPIALTKLAHAIERFTLDFSLMVLHETALPVLRFFALTHSLPVFVEHSVKDESGVASVASSLVKIFLALLDPKVLLVSHQVASVASTYAHVLTYTSDVSNRTTYNALLDKLRQIMLHSTEALSPVTVLMSLCERVTPNAKRYLFSDTAALLNALAKIYRVVCTLHRPSDEISSAHRVPDPNVLASRFERRRSHLPAKKSSPSPVAAQEPVHISLSPRDTTSPPTLVVSSEDLAEIDGELEALLDACVAVTTRYMPAAPGMKSRPVKLGSRKEGSEIVRVASCEAKARGGRSRIAKKTVGNRELIMIAEAVYAMSWRHFAAFQERLYIELVASRGQLELRPAQYAALVCIVLRAPPALPSAIFHCVADRLKRLIHAESVTSPLGEVLCVKHVRPIQDHPPLSLHDACAVVFAFAQKLSTPALPLLHDLLVRCSHRVQCFMQSSASTSFASSSSIAHIVGLVMFLASATRVFHADARGEPALKFITSARDLAATHVAALDPATVHTALRSEMSVSNLAYAALLLGDPMERDAHDVNAVRELVRTSFCTRVSECDCVELAQFLSEYFASSASYSALPHWMTASMCLEKHFTGSKRLPTLALLPLVAKTNDEGDMPRYVMHALEITRLYCRTFATLVATVQLFYLTDSALLTDTAVLNVVLRKITQLTRRTACPQDLFVFFTLYGDSPEVVSACISELVPEAHCFLVWQNSAAPLLRVHSALQTIARQRSRQLRQRWLSVMSPLIVQAVTCASDNPNAVLDVAELVAPDDPSLLQSILRSSGTIRGLRETFGSTAEGSTLMRLLLLLQGGNASNPTVRELHKAAVRVLDGPYHRAAPIEHLAQAMMLPSLEGRVIMRRLRRHFLVRVGKLMEGETGSDGEQRWDEVLNKLELDHWLVALRYKSFEETNSYRFDVELQEQRDEAQKWRQSKSQTTATVTKTIMTATTNTMTTPTNQIATSNEGNISLSMDDDGVQKDMDVNVTRRHRGLLLFLGFTPSSVMKLRASLGASHFIRFVNALLFEAAQVMGVDCTLSGHKSKDKQTCKHDEGYLRSQRLWMSDGTLSPLCYEGIRPWVSVAMQLVEAMSRDLDDFVRHEQEVINSQCKGKDTSKPVVLIDIEAVLNFTLSMDMYNPALYEQHLLESCSAEDIFSDAKGLSLRYLHRLLLKLPSQWGHVATAPCKSSVRLCNISAVLDYSAKDCRESEFDDFVNEETFSTFHSELVNIFGDSRPLLLDVCMPISDVRARQFRRCTLSKTHLFDALMQCLIHADEPPAATRARLATLGPRDISRVVQAICGGFYAKQGSTSAVADGAVDILTDLLPSSSATDVHDVVRTLVPLLESDAATAVTASLGIRRLLAHVAVVMGNDTERFPLQTLYDILQRLHEPYALVSPAAARQMLVGLNAETVSEKEKEIEAATGRAAKGTYMMVISLLRKIAADDHHKSNTEGNEMSESDAYEGSMFFT